jgi:hypothetical protein
VYIFCRAICGGTFPSVKSRIRHADTFDLKQAEKLKRSKHMSKCQWHCTQCSNAWEFKTKIAVEGKYIIAKSSGFQSSHIVQLGSLKRQIASSQPVTGAMKQLPNLRSAQFHRRVTVTFAKFHHTTMIAAEKHSAHEKSF